MRLSRLSFFAAALGLATASCNGCSKKGPDLSAPIVEAPVTAPALLVAELTVANPDAFWGKVQKGMGGLAGLMPAATGALLTSLTSLDSAAAPIIDGASPAYGALLGPTNAKRWALALRLTDLPHARQALFDAPTAKYTATDDGDFVLLAPKVAPPPNATPAAYVFAISKTGYLVVAQNKADIDEAGPYLVRTMPTHPAPTSDAVLDVPHASLAGALHDGLAQSWNERRTALAGSAKDEADAHGREADLADPAAILAASDQAMQKRLATIADLASIHVTLQASGDVLDADATITPGDPGGPSAQWLSALNHGDLAPLLDAPQGIGSVLWRTSDADRASLATDGEQLLRQVFARHLDDAEIVAARQALSDWSTGVGDHTLLSAATTPVFALRLTTPTAHPEALAKGTHEGLELLQKAVEQKAMKRMLGDAKVVFGTDEIVGVGKASTMKVDRYEGDDFSAAWLTQNGIFNLVFAHDASAALGAKPEKPVFWKDDARVAACATAAGPGASVALVAKPLEGDANAFVFGSFGLDGNRGKATLTVSDVLVREAVTSVEQ